MDRDERVMVFIDGSNLYHSLKQFFNRTDLDIGKLSQKLIEKKRLVRNYYYNATVGMKQEPERYRRQQAFLSSVQAVPYTELRLGRLVYNNWPGTAPYEKGIDIMLTTDLLTHSFKKNFDTAILVAGDTDYVGAIQAVKNNGQNVEVALFGQENGSKPLRDVADRVLTIDGKLLRNCWKNSHEIRPSHPQQKPPHNPVNAKD